MATPPAHVAAGTLRLGLADPSKASRRDRNGMRQCPIKLAGGDRARFEEPGRYTVVFGDKPGDKSRSLTLSPVDDECDTAAEKIARMQSLDTELERLVNEWKAADADIARVVDACPGPKSIAFEMPPYGYADGFPALRFSVDPKAVIYSPTGERIWPTIARGDTVSNLKFSVLGLWTWESGDRVSFGYKVSISSMVLTKGDRKYDM